MSIRDDVSQTQMVEILTKVADRVFTVAIVVGSIWFGTKVSDHGSTKADQVQANLGITEVQLRQSLQQLEKRQSAVESRLGSLTPQASRK